MKKKLLITSLLVAGGSITSYAEEINSVRLKESVISISGFESTSRDIAKNMTIISGKDLENKNYTEISDALRNVPGIQINKNTFGTFVDLRGQGTAKAKSNVQILVDGVNINPLDPAHGVLPLDTIPVGSIERIEIIPGGGAIMYGDGTVGGVINIITKIEAGKTYNKVGARVGSYGTQNYDVAVGQKITDDLAVQLAYSKDKTQGYREKDKKHNDYFEGAFNYKINKDNNVTFKYTRFEEKGNWLEGLTKEKVNENRRQSGYNESRDPWESPNKLNLKRDSYNLNFQSRLSEDVLFDLDTSYQKTKNKWGSIMKTLKMDEEGKPVIKLVLKPGDTKPVVEPVFDGTLSEGLFTDKKVQVSPKIKYEYGNKSQLVVGFDYKTNKAIRKSLKPGYLGRYLDYDFNMKKETFAGYVFNKTKIDKFEFTQGVRREKSKYHSNRYASEYALMWPESVPDKLKAKRIEKKSFNEEMVNDAYELGANYLYSDTGNVYGRFENGFRTPAPSQFLDKINNIYIENNLKEETYKTFELGAKDYIFNSFVSLTGFYTETKNEILQIGQMPKYWEFLNLGKTERKGVEAQAEQYFDKLTLTESFSYIEAKIKSNGNDKQSVGKYIPGVSKYSASLAAKYDFTSQLNTVLTLTYKDGYYLDKENKSGKVNKRLVTDITVNYTLENGLKLYAGINNIFSEKYYNDVYMENNTVYYDPAAERNYYAGFEYKF